MASDEVEGTSPLPHADEHITLIGLGAIGVSFLALHLTYSSATVSVYDPRPDLEEHIQAVLPLYLPSSVDVASLISVGRLNLCASLEEACLAATIVQEQGPENVGFKQKTWSEVIRYVAPTCHLWSSTSGIPASKQLEHLSTTDDKHLEYPPTTDDIQASSARQRLLIVHPFNPPHIMPLLELVPSPHTTPAEVSFAKSYFTALRSGHRPITIHRESAGFVANRLSFILFREACHLVNEGVASAEEIDEVVRASLGPRWAMAGPFKMYGFGGGNKGLRGFLDNIGESIGEVWRDAGTITMDDDAWKDKVVEQTTQAYGLPSAEDIRVRDGGLRAVVKAQEEQERVARHGGGQGGQ
ncbi:hypothetical protein A1O3_00835 [Capronia epimyces CBS 606.96]|uniref:Hydroxylacyl-CoA dehydrogenase n=1 Tax=Capronia epimyces CBS 606.96 TaxID=1182542 RepID=W9YRH3_9EURO|nr:uncharacterized protein A1O3_00835 [Capronia epimyces CBS 606.96]EXJ92285.1 hypothetical protein A1O3_00835 [Capronia epimyces CBS 606.96]